MPLLVKGTWQHMIHLVNDPVNTGMASTLRRYLAVIVLYQCLMPLSYLVYYLVTCIIILKCNEWGISIYTYETWNFVNAIFFYIIVIVIYVKHFPYNQ